MGEGTGIEGLYMHSRAALIVIEISAHMDTQQRAACLDITLLLPWVETDSIIS